MHHRVSQLYLYFSYRKNGSSASGGTSPASILQGAFSVNIFSCVGHRFPGVAAGVTAVTLPCFLLMLVPANPYQRWEEMPAVANAFKGFILAVVAVAFASAWNLQCKTLAWWKQSDTSIAAIIVTLAVPSSVYSMVIYIVSLFLLVRIRTPVSAANVSSGLDGRILYQGAV